MIKGLFLVLLITLISSMIFAFLILASYFVFLLIYGKISGGKRKMSKPTGRTLVIKDSFLERLISDYFDNLIKDVQNQEDKSITISDMKEGLTNYIIKHSNHITGARTKPRQS